MKTLITLGVAALCCVLAPGIAPAADSFSFEGSLEDWVIEGLFPGGVTGTPKTVADGIPAAAVTDGEYALEIEHFNGGNWTQIARAPGAYETSPGSGEWVDVIHNALLANTTMEFDLYAPTDSIVIDDWAKMEVEIEGDGMKFNLPLEFVTAGDQVDPVGMSYHFYWDYAADSRFNPTAEWAQVTLVSQGTNAAWMSPLYIDAFRLTGASVATGADFNEDGVVDGSDFLIWQETYGATSGGDADGNGIVNDADFAIWQADFGGAPAAVSSVPEPSAAALVAVFALCRANRRRKS
ncbi:MAG: hypothetical protein KDA61_15925 [Planctomycetales bacterium]|nr:hypothetical protein [Planctomycetales bacterium]